MRVDKFTVVFAVALSGCAHTSVSDALTKIEVGLSLAQQAADQAVEQFCAVAPEEECNELKEHTAKVLKGLEDAGVILQSTEPTAQAIDKAIENSKQ